ncbi:hypothetical protein HOE04_01850 [archaeon]|jgi:hypothetical protein|nr:hypothetical protein [archaeon]
MNQKLTEKVTEEFNKRTEEFEGERFEGIKIVGVRSLIRELNARGNSRIKYDLELEVTEECKDRDYAKTAHLRPEKLFMYKIVQKKNDSSKYVGVIYESMKNPENCRLHFQTNDREYVEAHSEIVWRKAQK